MSIRARAALLASAAALVLSVAACSGSATSSAGPTLPPNEATACVAMSAFAEAVLQFEGVDVAAIGASNLAPQVNRLRGTYNAVVSSLTFVDVPSEPELEEAWATFESALAGIDQAAPTQGQVDTAKAAAGDVKTAFGKVQDELGCP